MERLYQAEFTHDFSTLEFLAEGQDEALRIVASHAQPDDEFHLRVKKVEGKPWEGKPWEEVKRASYWKVKYYGDPGNSPCKRVR